MARPKDAHLLHLQQTELNPFSRPATPGHHGVQIGFCGLGAMGYPMARNMARWRKEHVQGGLPVLVWNRTKSKSDALAKELGAEAISVAASLEEVIDECGIIFTNLSSDEVVREMYQKFAKMIEERPGKSRIFVETGTIYPTVAAELDNILGKLPSTTFVLSPVFGPPAVAEVARLLISMAGNYQSKKEVAHIMYPSMGRKVIDLGGNVEKAATFKLLGNSMILGSLELIAESFALGEKAGIGAPMTYSLLKELLPAPTIEAYGDKMLHDKFDGTKGFAIDGGIKDSQHIRRLTTELNSPMPSLDAAHHHLLTARALHQAQVQRGEAHFGVLDWSALIVGARLASGLDAFDNSKHGKAVPEKDE